jgi:hypothetical protein
MVTFAASRMVSRDYPSAYPDRAGKTVPGANRANRRVLRMV